MKLFRFVGLLTLLLALVVTACAPAAAPASGEGEAVGEQDFVTWYQYDENNEDPASDERVGNAYLRETMPQFNEAFDGVWNWVNQPKAFDKMATELIAAVQAGGEAPDLMQVENWDLFSYYQNGALLDLTEWAETQPWFSDLDASSLAACRGPDGAIYCVPLSQKPQLVYVLRDHFPDGYPATPEQFLTHAAELKEEGVYAITFFGSTDFDGLGLQRFIWTTLSSFGGTLDDGAGSMTLNTPENIAAVEFIRQIVTNGYAPEIVFAGQFQEEEAFKDASAASFPTGLFGYRYVNPLYSPGGNAYEKKNEEDMLDAIAAGDVYLSPFVAPEGLEPGCNLAVTSLAIPATANNVQAAQDYINWIMAPEQNAAWVLGPGGGFPALLSTQSDPLFDTPFYNAASEAVAASQCRPWYGSLERRQEAQKLIMTTIYKLIKEDPDADIAEALSATEAEYNAGG